MPEAGPALDEGGPVGAEFGSPGLDQQEDQHRDAQAYVEEVQPGENENEVVEIEVVFTGPFPPTSNAATRAPSAR